MRTLIAASAAMLLALPVASQTLPDGTQFSNGPVMVAASGGSQNPTAACSSYNMKATAGFGGGNANVFATGSWVASASQVVFGASVRTSAKTAAGGKVTCQIAVVDATGMPTAVNAAKCTITVANTTLATYSGKFATPILLKAGTRYALVHAGDGQVMHPISTSAGATTVTHFWHSPTATAWSGPWNSQSWSVQVDCSPGGGNPGKFATYGTGCTGTGGSGSCHSQNMTCGTPRGGGNTNVFATSFKVATATAATGARLRTNNAGTFNIEIYKTDPAGKPTTQVGKAGTITIGAAYATYSGNFPAPIPLLPGNYALIHNRLTGTSSHPICPGASPTTHYWHVPPSVPNATWSGPWNTQGWAFEVICLGGGSIPMISNTGVPTIGASFSVDLKKAAGNAPCALFIGANRINIDLTGLGAPSCTWLAAAHVVLSTKATAAGTATTKLAVPNNTWYVSKTLDFQWVVIDAGANKLGVALTAGGEATIGK